MDDMLAGPQRICQDLITNGGCGPHHHQGESTMNIKKLKSLFAKLEDITATLEEIHDKAETTYGFKERLDIVEFQNVLDEIEKISLKPIAV